MNTNITVRHENVSDATKHHIQEKLGKLDRYRLQRVDVILDSEGSNYKVEVAAYPDRGSKYVASSEGTEWYAAVDSVVDKIERQLRKAKEKITNHHNKKPQDFGFDRSDIGTM